MIDHQGIRFGVFDCSINNSVKSRQGGDDDCKRDIDHIPDVDIVQLPSSIFHWMGYEDISDISDNACNRGHATNCKNSTQTTFLDHGICNRTITKIGTHNKAQSIKMCKARAIKLKAYLLIHFTCLGSFMDARYRNE